MARFTAGLLKTAMQTLYQTESEKLEEYVRQMENNALHEYITQTLSENIERHRVTNIVNGYIVGSETETS